MDYLFSVIMRFESREHYGRSNFAFYQFLPPAEKGVISLARHADEQIKLTYHWLLVKFEFFFPFPPRIPSR
jgi:hypothetical protein